MACKNKIPKMGIGETVPSVNNNFEVDVPNLDLSIKANYFFFIRKLSELIKNNPESIINTLSNILTMREIGNKTHGDMAEIGMNEYVNYYLPTDFSSIHVGKVNFRAKELEEDIEITNKKNGVKIPVSIKTYGDGPLQLSTDKNSRMFPRLGREKGTITDKKIIDAVFEDPSFQGFSDMNVLPLIYDEKEKRCNIMLFDFAKAREKTKKIVLEEPEKRRKHPAYLFYDKKGAYICEVRYGDASANALQRGLWTNTNHAKDYFKSITNGWISYSVREDLLKIMPMLMNATPETLGKVLSCVQEEMHVKNE